MEKVKEGLDESLNKGELEVALMKWQQSVQKAFIKIIRQPTLGTKVALVQIILNFIPFEETVKVTKDYKVWKNTKTPKESENLMDVENP